MNAVKGVVFKVLATQPVLFWGVSWALAFAAAHGLPINDEKTKADVVRIIGLVLGGGAVQGVRSSVFTAATHQKEKAEVALETATRLDPKTVGPAGALAPTATTIVKNVVDETAKGVGGIAGGLLRGGAGLLKGVLGRG